MQGMLKKRSWKGVFITSGVYIQYFSTRIVSMKLKVNNLPNQKYFRSQGTNKHGESIYYKGGIITHWHLYNRYDG